MAIAFDCANGMKYFEQLVRGVFGEPAHPLRQHGGVVAAFAEAVANESRFIENRVREVCSGEGAAHDVAFLKNTTV